MNNGKASGYLILIPAYGRDYKNRKEILEDFNTNKDFTLCTPLGTTYINKEQINIGAIIEFRYKRLSELFIYKVVEPPPMILTPTPGVDYKGKRSVLKDFNEFAEFAWERDNTLSYISKERIKVGTVIEFRHDNQGKSFTHKVEKES